jgi:hypothetical protein
MPDNAFLSIEGKIEKCPKFKTRELADDFKSGCIDPVCDGMDDNAEWPAQFVKIDGTCGDCESGRTTHPMYPTRPCVLIAPAYRPSSNPVESDCACYQTWDGAAC